MVACRVLEFNDASIDWQARNSGVTRGGGQGGAAAPGRRSKGRRKIGLGGEKLGGAKKKIVNKDVTDD